MTAETHGKQHVMLTSCAAPAQPQFPRLRKQLRSYHLLLLLQKQHPITLAYHAPASHIIEALCACVLGSGLQGPDKCTSLPFLPLTDGLHYDIHMTHPCAAHL